MLFRSWKKTAEDLIAFAPKSIDEFMHGKLTSATSTLRDVAGWFAGSWTSICDDPLWHASWMLDVQTKWLRAAEYMVRGQKDPRTKGVSQEVTA